MRPNQPAMDVISADEIIAAFGRVFDGKSSASLPGGIYQVLFLPSQLETPGSATHYTAFCPFTGIVGRGITVAQAYKAWISAAIGLLACDGRPSHTVSADWAPYGEELTTRKVAVGEIMVASMRDMAPVFVIDVLQSEREVVVCPQKNEVGAADKNSESPVISADGKEMKVPGFLVDLRIPCTNIHRFPALSTACSPLSTPVPSTTATAVL